MSGYGTKGDSMDMEQKMNKIILVLALIPVSNSRGNYGTLLAMAAKEKGVLQCLQLCLHMMETFHRTQCQKKHLFPQPIQILNHQCSIPRSWHHAKSQRHISFSKLHHFTTWNPPGRSSENSTHSTRSSTLPAKNMRDPSNG